MTARRTASRARRRARYPPPSPCAGLDLGAPGGAEPPAPSLTFSAAAGLRGNGGPRGCVVQAVRPGDHRDHGWRPVAEATRSLDDRTGPGPHRLLTQTLSPGQKPRIRRIVTSRPAARVVEMTVVLSSGRGPARWRYALSNCPAAGPRPGCPRVRRGGSAPRSRSASRCSVRPVGIGAGPRSPMAGWCTRHPNRRGTDRCGRPGRSRRENPGRCWSPRASRRPRTEQSTAAAAAGAGQTRPGPCALWPWQAGVPWPPGELWPHAGEPGRRAWAPPPPDRTWGLCCLRAPGAPSARNAALPLVPE